MKLLTTFSLLAALALCAGCNQQPSTSAGPADSNSKAAAKNLKLAFLTNNAANFWTIARRGTEAAEKQLGNGSVEFRIPSSGSAAEQQQILDDLMAKGVDG